MTTDELPVRLTRKQEQMLKSLGENISWVITRKQGTGLRYWQAHLCAGPEWTGTETTFEALTFNQLFKYMRYWVEKYAQ